MKWLWVSALLLIAGPAGAEEKALSVRTQPVKSFTMFSQLVTFGGLEWRGGIELASDDERFGGLSSLELSADGTGLLAVSDRGFWFKAVLVYTDDHLSGLKDAVMAPILGPDGKPYKGKVRNDAEALAGWEPMRIDGKVIVGFESRARAGLYDLGKDGFKARFKDLKLPKAVAKGPPNQELEAIGRFASGPLAGSMLAISELNKDENGDIRAWVWGGKKAFGFSIKQYEDYAITDLAILPDGDVLTVERSFSATSLPGMAVRRIKTEDIVADGAVAPSLVFSGRMPFYRIDNMEGIAVSKLNGETRVTIISDNNYRPQFQRTLLLQFALKP
ncbi:esterase-like activity of phytase family protein [Aestuariivirga sp. YIM B02566]|uniref:Esterase-like activity of phytase family protein n=1 Tax=Taklimakanibacter albus TaxID=2800327 RepID=A0ACC5R6B6_9HYPH|nr:esterase-like activity of phytase family protein [Aestuariivirga sp. YIM B02566]MBK1868177.1 esterase-like activity of phytase family protein [Aestuariivirga sp. YIM B02566]